MAIVHPSGWRELRGIGAAVRELETLSYLAEHLPDDYTVYHGVHWTRLSNGFSIYGEVDFAVVAPNARVLIIEQKSGYLEETENGLFKAYSGQKKSVAAQIARSIEGLQARYSKGSTGQRLSLEFVLYCPDYRVLKPHIAGLENGHIIDSQKKDELAEIIQRVLSAGLENPEETARICKFFEGILELVPDIGAISKEADALYTRVSGGLATWGRRIDANPFRLRVIGTAGSGKTQLALAALRDADAEGRRALYVCFNRSLADQLSPLVPATATVLSFHQLCDQVARSCGRIPDFSKHDVYKTLEQSLLEYKPTEAWSFDEIIIDEGQDFQQSWAHAVLGLLKPQGKAWWLEDPMQNLYRRPTVVLPGWTVLRSDTNYRSPRDILHHLNQLIGLERPLEAGSLLAGTDTEIINYKDTASLIDETKRAITRCIAHGFQRSMISVLTYRGRESSALNVFDSIGQYSLRKFTGTYDLLGAPIYTDGEISLETVHRFKGQSAPAIIFTEIDFEQLDEDAVRRIFVGATRASMKLIMIVSDRAANLFIERLDQ
jgi:hypothetical protein